MWLLSWLLSEALAGENQSAQKPISGLGLRGVAGTGESTLGGVFVMGVLFAALVLVGPVCAAGAVDAVEPFAAAPLTIPAAFSPFAAARAGEVSTEADETARSGAPDADATDADATDPTGAITAALAT